MADEKVLTTTEIAAKLKLDPKRLRAIMRANGVHAPKSGRYQFHEKDLPKLIASIKDHESKQPAKAKK
jgi:hypothetical protein